MMVSLAAALSRENTYHPPSVVIQKMREKSAVINKLFENMEGKRISGQRDLNIQTGAEILCLVPIPTSRFWFN